MKLLANKVAAVTGGATGIGRSICLAMAEQGADIAILYVAVIPQEVVDETGTDVYYDSEGIRKHGIWNSGWNPVFYTGSLCSSDQFYCTD